MVISFSSSEGNLNDFFVSWEEILKDFSSSSWVVSQTGSFSFLVVN